MSKKKGGLNLPKLALFCIHHGITVGYGLIILPWVWTYIDLPYWPLMLVSILVLAVLWVPVLGGISALLFAYFVMGVTNTLMIGMLAPLMILIAVLALYPDRIMAMSKNEAKALDV